MTPTLTILPGGCTPRQPPPLEWEHVVDPAGRDREVVAVRWWTEQHSQRACLLVIEDEEPAWIDGTEPDPDTMREISADIRRWNEAQEYDRRYTAGRLPGARYHA